MPVLHYPPPIDGGTSVKDGVHLPCYGPWSMVSWDSAWYVLVAL